MQHAQKMVLVSPDTLSSVKDPRPISSATFTRSKLDLELKEILDKTDLTPYDKVQRYNQILQRYLTFYDQTVKRPMTVKVTQDNTSDPDPSDNDDNKSTTGLQQPGGATSTDVPDSDEEAESLLVNFPVSIKKKAKTLFSIIKKSNGILDFNDQGELLLDGHVIRGSHVSDLVYDTLFGKSGLEPRGMEQFLSGLVRINVPERLIANKSRRVTIRRMKQSTPPSSKKRGITPTIAKRRKTSTRGSKSGGRPSTRIGRLNWETYT